MARKKKEREPFLRSIYSIHLDDLSDSECRQWLEAMFYYQKEGCILENITSGVKTIIRRQIEERKEDKENYEEVCEKRKKAVEQRRNKGIQEDTNVYKCIQVNTSDTNSNSNNNILSKDNIKKENKLKEKKNNRFEEFWKEYPLKKGKQKAEERYKQALKNGVSEDLLITKAKEYAEECRIKNTEPKYIKRPEGWINGGRYEDTYITAKPKQVESDDDKPYDFEQDKVFIPVRKRAWEIQK